MKILKKEDDFFQAQITQDEYDLLCRLLRLYPMIPRGYHTLSHQTPDREDQKLLDEIMDETCSENKKTLEDFLQSDEFFRPEKNGVMMTLTGHQVEWLLQILNDIRVGLWVRLGCPDEKTIEATRTPENQEPDRWNMELCGFLISVLLDP